MIAIDGPAASGKSSTSRWVAERLGIRHVDSGSLYRAITAARLREVEPGSTGWSEVEVLRAAQRCGLQPEKTSFAPTIDGEVADSEVRSTNVNRMVSHVAQIPRVREWVNEHVREVARSHDVVVDGRDIGTIVFPDAELKIFLVADPWERARRRLIQSLGRHPADDEIALETEILVQRDARDAMQTVQARDAVLIDTTYLSQAEQVDRIVSLAKAVNRLPGTTSAVDFN